MAAFPVKVLSLYFRQSGPEVAKVQILVLKKTLVKVEVLTQPPYSSKSKALSKENY